MNRESVKRDFQAMMRTFTCANVDVKFKGVQTEGMIPSLSSERRLFMSGSDPDWQSTLYVAVDDLDGKNVDGKDTIEVKDADDSRYVKYRCGAPKIVSKAFWRIELKSVNSG